MIKYVFNIFKKELCGLNKKDSIELLTHVLPIVQYPYYLFEVISVNEILNKFFIEFNLKAFSQKNGVDEILTLVDNIKNTLERINQNDNYELYVDEKSNKINYEKEKKWVIFQLQGKMRKDLKGH